MRLARGECRIMIGILTKTNIVLSFLLTYARK